MDSKTKILYAVITALVLTNCYMLMKFSKAHDDVKILMEMMSDVIASGETEEAKAKDNTPIGKYIPEGEGLKFNLKLGLLYLCLRYAIYRNNGN